MRIDGYLFLFFFFIVFLSKTEISKRRRKKAVGSRFSKYFWITNMFDSLTLIFLLSNVWYFGQNLCAEFENVSVYLIWFQENICFCFLFRRLILFIYLFVFFFFLAVKAYLENVFSLTTVISFFFFFLIFISFCLNGPCQWILAIRKMAEMKRFETVTCLRSKTEEA